MLEQLRIGGQFAPVRILQKYVCYDSATQTICRYFGAEAVAPDWFHYRDRVIELRVLAFEEAD